MLLSSIVAFASVSLTLASPLTKRGLGYTFGSGNTVRGVNIGGWLVSEPFITPSLYEAEADNVVDEYTYGKYVDNAISKLQTHWSSWATAADINKIAGLGFNFIRIPIGFWSLVETPPYVFGAAAYLDEIITWARVAKLFVVIDLHGAPGSQNGFDNSGQRMDTPQWLTQPGSLDLTLKALGVLTGKYAQPAYQDVVVAIEVLNEPLMSELPGGQGAVESYYTDAYYQIRNISDTNVMLHTGFVPAYEWNSFAQPPDFQNIVLDFHYYQAFTNDYVSLSTQDHISRVCEETPGQTQGRDLWMINGEFSAAMDDCALWLNGRGVGARFDGSYTINGGSTRIGDCNFRNNSANWDDGFKAQTQAFLERQMQAFEQQTFGYVFWNFKTETATAWSLFDLDRLGLVPQPLNNYKYGNVICT